MVEKGMKTVIIMLVAVTMASVLAISGVLIFVLMDKSLGPISDLQLKFYKRK